MWTRRGRQKRCPQQWSSFTSSSNSGLEEYTASGDDGTVIASCPCRVAETIKRTGTSFPPGLRCSLLLQDSSVRRTAYPTEPLALVQAPCVVEQRARYHRPGE